MISAPRIVVVSVIFFPMGLFYYSSANGADYTISARNPTAASAMKGAPLSRDRSKIMQGKAPVLATSGPEDNTSVETNPPARSTIPSEVEAENQRIINELRSELLDDRADYIDRWLIAVTIVLAFFGILGFKRFREIEAEARKSVEAAKRYEADAKDHAERIEALQGNAVADVQRIRDLMTAEVAAQNPAEANQAVKDARENPEASLTDKAIADAVSLQQQGRNKEAIDKWQVIANLAEGTDNDLAARALFSVGYLLQGEDLKRSISAYNEAILLKPDLYEAYNNRGNVKLSSGQHEAAIIDFGEAINLKPDFAVAYNNRGIAKVKLNLNDEARKDFETALELARNANDAKIVAQAEQLLRDLDAAEGS